jgi:hypothetical protein
LETQQDAEKKSLGLENPTFENDLWFNYRALQIYDLLSLYFCCDGYADDDHFKEDGWRSAYLMIAKPSGTAHHSHRRSLGENGAVSLRYRAADGVGQGLFRPRATVESVSGSHHKAPRKLLS